MNTNRQNNGLQTFVEHWGFLSIVIVALVVSQALTFFSALKGIAWIVVFVVSFAFLIAGGSLIFYAKFPLYRSGRFFTFGVKSVPEHLKRSYRWGWRLFLFGIVISLCLLLSKP